MSTNLFVAQLQDIIDGNRPYDECAAQGWTQLIMASLGKECAMRYLCQELLGEMAALAREDAAHAHLILIHRIQAEILLSQMEDALRAYDIPARNQEYA